MFGTLDFGLFLGKVNAFDDGLGQEFAFPADFLGFGLFLAVVLLGFFLEDFHDFGTGHVAVVLEHENVVAHGLLPVGEQHLVNVVKVHEFNVAEFVYQRFREFYDKLLHIYRAVDVHQLLGRLLEPCVKGVVNLFGVGLEFFVVEDCAADFVFLYLELVIARTEFLEEFVLEARENIPVAF